MEKTVIQRYIRLQQGASLRSLDWNTLVERPHLHKQIINGDSNATELNSHLLHSTFQHPLLLLKLKAPKSAKSAKHPPSS